MGGVERFDNNMIDTMFDLSTYVSDNDDKDVEINDDHDSEPNLGGRNNVQGHVKKPEIYLRTAAMPVARGIRPIRYNHYLLQVRL